MILNSPADANHPHVSRGVFLTGMLVVAAVSVALRGEATPDVSWLITMCERMLNGERAYVDNHRGHAACADAALHAGRLIREVHRGAPEAATFAFAR
jgi:hypothetical protein